VKVTFKYGIKKFVIMAEYQNTYKLQVG